MPAEADAIEREKWLSAGSEITTMLLQGLPEDEVLEHIVTVAREIAHADGAALILPGLKNELIVEIVRGWGTEDILGLAMPHDGVAWTALRTGMPKNIPSLADAKAIAVPEMRKYGPALYAPMGTSEKPVGVLVLLRKVGQESFIAKDMERASTFADQAALALVVSEARQTQDMGKLVEERERIARDLHDLAIQQLFATGMQLEVVRRRAARGLDKAGLIAILDEALDNIDNSVREIRSIVHSLRDPDAATGLVERLRREASLARTGLGFAPSLVIMLDDRAIGALDQDEQVIDGLVSKHLTDDVLAVCREGLANAARHAQAQSVAVRVTVTTPAMSHDGIGRVDVEVEDDGIGLQFVSGRKSGTWNISARARQYGGEYSLENSPTGHGALLKWNAPLKSARLEEQEAISSHHAEIGGSELPDEWKFSH